MSLAFLADLAGDRGHARHRRALHHRCRALARHPRQRYRCGRLHAKDRAALVAAITGTAALLRASGFAFEALKVLGVAYLLYMAWTTWRDKGTLVVSEDLPPGSARQIVTSAVLVTLLNPKLTIFFFAFLPQLVPAGAGQPVRWPALATSPV